MCLLWTEAVTRLWAMMSFLWTEMGLLTVGLAASWRCGGGAVGGVRSVLLLARLLTGSHRITKPAILRGGRGRASVFELI